MKRRKCKTWTPDQKNWSSCPVNILTQYLILYFCCRIRNYPHNKYLKGRLKGCRHPVQTRATKVIKNEENLVSTVKTNNCTLTQKTMCSIINTITTAKKPGPFTELKLTSKNESVDRCLVSRGLHSKQSGCDAEGNLSVQLGAAWIIFRAEGET